MLGLAFAILDLTYLELIHSNKNSQKLCKNGYFCL